VLEVLSLEQQPSLSALVKKVSQSAGQAADNCAPAVRLRLCKRFGQRQLLAIELE
jgi:hypothetical protein